MAEQLEIGLAMPMSISNKPLQWKPNELSNAIENVLENDGYSKKAEYLQNTIQAEGYLHEGIPRLIESLVKHGYEHYLPSSRIKEQKPIFSIQKLIIITSIVALCGSCGIILKKK